MARALSQEGAICVIDTGTTVLTWKQSKLRTEKGACNAVIVAREHSHSISVSASSSLPRERLEVLGGYSMDQLPEHNVSEVYWYPQHVLPDVIELSDGSGSFLAICSQHGLRAGDWMSPNGICLHNILYTLSREKLFSQEQASPALHRTTTCHRSAT